ncbi:YncE family protein [Clostridium gasigenes]|uniref:40-residue YVTN family beta-propeller repeat-containing protein n=1 Tax=Clostridium gasigenes TaxID=94869 RepID=A0A1H0UFR7_9CLOT|nr:YncE family protein [Clostridium gasigenes]MBB6621873.1 YncE family protein [Clostridium gasigenes]MBU3102815.1 YncE family protein [Clostridium gasigenes]NKF08361.1 YncE family protein [Clostridium gasigenes]QSW18675.1 YncE family protein [Clostridium gasigenes]SDP64910.1 40-residue YVTN family beta-propeller repeat-containing protein [Clostridium gasigenes]
MKSLFVCNTGSDSISKINIKDFSVENLVLKIGEKPIGPQGICLNENLMYTANNYNNSISIIEKETLIEIDNFYIGPYPNDLVYYHNRLYIACGDANAIIVYDLIEKKIVFKLPTGLWPHNIELAKSKGLILVSNLQGNNVSIIDANINKEIANIKTLEYPTQIRISKDENKFYVCESYIGDIKCGYIEVFSLEDFKSLKRIKVGKSPMDIWDDGKLLYISNFNDGSISVVDVSLGMEIDNIIVGGMPKGILKYGNNLLIGDYLRSKVIVLNLDNKLTKAIAVGVEPNAMALC